MDYDPPELDGLRWYVDFDKCDEILWEKFFHCHDLGLCLLLLPPPLLLLSPSAAVV